MSVGLLPLAPATPTLDEIQDFALDRVENVRLSGRKSAILQKATGTGKTFTAAKFIKRGREHGRRFLFLCHRDILIEQAAGEFREAGITFAVEQAEKKAGDAMTLFGTPPEVVIGSKDSMQGSRLERWSPDRFTDIITDECHLASAQTFANVYAHFAGAKFHLGLSATPYRLDGVQLFGPPNSLFGDGAFRRPYEMEGLPPGSKVHEAVAFKYPLASAIANGHLANVVGVNCEVPVDLTDIRVSKGKIKDFNKGDLEARISAVMTPLVNEIDRQMSRLNLNRVLLFSPDVGSARAFATAFRQIGRSSAAVWTGSKDHPLPDTMKRQAIEKYKNGDLEILCSCEILTTGFNDPPTQAVVNCRPTKSLGLFLQIVGRATRTHAPSGKRDCYVLGFEWRGADGVVSTLDLLTEDEPRPKVRQTAARLFSMASGDVKPTDILDEARKVVERDEEAERRRMAATDLRVNVDRVKVAHKYRELTPFAASKLFDLPAPRTVRAGKLEPMSFQQREVLSAYGLKKFSGIDRDSAEVMIREFMDRDFRRLATPEQVRQLVKRGVKAEDAKMQTQAQAAEELRKPRPVSGSLRGWLISRGYRPDAIRGMTQDEAARLYGRWRSIQGR